jgi:hypothetical protein
MSSTNLDFAGLSQISNAFLEDHKKLKGLLKNLLRFVRQHPLADVPQSHISHINWNFERHIYLEEKAAFIYCEMNDPNDRKDQGKLMRDHDVIIQNMQRFIHNPLSFNQDEIDEMFQFLEKHIKWVSNNIYRRFDENLNPEERNYIIKELTKDLEHGFYPLNKLREKFVPIPQLEPITE